MVCSLHNHFHLISSATATGQEDQSAATQRRCRISKSVHLSTSVSLFIMINNPKCSGFNTVSAGPAVLELISVHSKIAVMQRLISVHIEKSRTNFAGEALYFVS